MIGFIYLRMHKALLFVILVYGSLSSFAQEKDERRFYSLFDEIDVGTEFRPRFEFRHGYQGLRNASDAPSYHINQRTRINGLFQGDKLSFYTSIQDVRIWGEEDTRATAGGLMIFEVFVEPRLSKNMTLRIGRQMVTLDDERLFARNDWRPQGGKHDGLRLIYKSSKSKMETFAAYNQNYESIRTGLFDPGFESYVFLAANHFKTSFKNDRIQLAILNFIDGYQNTNNTAIYASATSGGTIKYNGNILKTKAEAYVQYGHVETGQRHFAYFANPEVGIHWSKFKSAVGVEYLSGTNNGDTTQTSSSFLARYGAFHQHNGRMDYTARLVRTLNHEGLIDWYWKNWFLVTEQVKIGLETHAFSIASQQTKLSDQNLGSYLGVELDASIRWKPNSFTEIQLAYMTMLANKSRSVLYGGNHAVMQQFAFLQASFTPQLFSFRASKSQMEEINIITP